MSKVLLRTFFFISIVFCNAVYADSIIAESSEIDDTVVPKLLVDNASQVSHNIPAEKQFNYSQHRRPTSSAPLHVQSQAAASCTWEMVGIKHNVNPSLLYAIAKTESGLNPNAINKNSNGSYDIGLMQINSSWLPTLARYGVYRESLFDPCISLDVGAWILSENIRKMGNNWTAIGAYNARSDVKRIRYAQSVYKNLPVSVQTH